MVSWACPCLLIYFLTILTVYQQPLPFDLNGLIFNVSKHVPEGRTVHLYCGYLPRYSTQGFKMIISFVPEVNLTEVEVVEASSSQFIFPSSLQVAHKRSGKVINVSTKF